MAVLQDWYSHEYSIPVSDVRQGFETYRVLKVRLSLFQGPYPGFPSVLFGIVEALDRSPGGQTRGPGYLARQW